MLFAVGAASCLDSSGPSTPTPAAGPQAPSNPSIALTSPEVQLPIPLALLGDGQSAAQKVQINIFKVEGGLRGEALKEPFEFGVNAESLYTLSGLEAGPLEISATVTDASGQTLAEGAMRANIVAGLQTLPELILRRQPAPSETEARPVLLDLTLNLTIKGPPAPPEPTEPAVVRAALKASSCLGCHSQRSARGGLVLEKFPYQTQNTALSAGGQVAIVREMAARMSSTDAPMPPTGFPATKPENIKIIEAFAESLTATAEASARPATEASAPLDEKSIAAASLEIKLGAASRIVLPLQKDGLTFRADATPGLIAGQSYHYSLRVYDPQNLVLLDLPDAVFTVPADGKVNLLQDMNASRGG